MNLPAAASVTNSFVVYVCPTCRRHLQQESNVLRCLLCARDYPIIEQVPDFVLEELSRSADPVLRRMRFIDRMAPLYETRLWYPLVLNLYGGLASPSLPQLINKVTQEVQSIEGRVLDVARGPGTYGRRVASPTRDVLGIDISMGMLRQGVAYVKKEGVRNMHFARARVESLPFANKFFDAVICSGSLHLFADTVIALREIGRVIKPEAVLSVFTFGVGHGGVLKFHSVREWSRRRHGLHVFELSQIERYLAVAGFENFHPELSGSILTFTARRGSGG